MERLNELEAVLMCRLFKSAEQLVVFEFSSTLLVCPTFFKFIVMSLRVPNVSVPPILCFFYLYFCPPVGLTSLPLPTVN